MIKIEIRPDSTSLQGPVVTEERTNGEYIPKISAQNPWIKNLWKSWHLMIAC